MAIGITAAGVSSIPASAASYYRDKAFSVHTVTAHGYVLYTPNSSYKSVTRSAFSEVRNRNVCAGIFSNGINLGIDTGWRAEYNSSSLSDFYYGV